MKRTKGRCRALFGTGEKPSETAPLANGASNKEDKNHMVLNDAFEKEVADIVFSMLFEESNFFYLFENAFILLAKIHNPIIFIDT